MYSDTERGSWAKAKDVQERATWSTKAMKTIDLSDSCLFKVSYGSFCIDDTGFFEIDLV